MITTFVIFMIKLPFLVFRVLSDTIQKLFIPDKKKGKHGKNNKRKT